MGWALAGQKGVGVDVNFGVDLGVDVGQGLLTQDHGTDDEVVLPLSA